MTNLVSHLYEASEGEFEHHVLLERDKVPHVLQNEEARTVIVTVAQVGYHQGVLGKKRGTVDLSTLILKMNRQ